MRDLPPCTIEEDPAGKLAGLVFDTSYSDMTPAMRETAKKSLYDTCAVIIAGSGRMCSPFVANLMKEWSGEQGQSTVLVYGYKAPPPFAAFVNGTMARTIDMGDVHNSGGHISEWIVPALLAALPLAEKPVTGKEFLTAYCAGAEVGARIHTCSGLLHHETSNPGEWAGSFYATSAVSKMLGLSKEQIWNALGLGFSVHSYSEHQKTWEGKQITRLQHGFVGDTAIKAAVLAKADITGIKGIFMGISGALRCMPYDDFDENILTSDLGKRWLWAEGLTIKPYASCKFTTAAISGIVEIMHTHNFDYTQIASIHCKISRGAECCVEPHEGKFNPTSAAEAIFSLPYTIAHAAIYGDVFIDAMEDGQFDDPRKKELMRNMTFEYVDTPTPFDGYTVEITTKDGAVYSSYQDRVPGSVTCPMTWEQLDEKFMKCVPYAQVKLPVDKFSKIKEICQNLEDVSDMNALVEAMTP